MSVTLQAAVHLGQDYSKNPRSIKNQLSKSVKQLFRTTERLTKDQVEITGLSTTDWNQPTWRESYSLRDRAVHIMKSQTYVFFAVSGRHSYCTSPSMEKARLNGIWRHAIAKIWIIDGEQMEFEWTNFPGFTTLGILDEIQKIMAELRCESKQYKGRVIFMWMYDDITRRTQANHENCMANSACAKKFQHGCWSFLGPGCEKKWYGTHVSKPNGEWNKTVEVMMLNFACNYSSSTLPAIVLRKWYAWKLVKNCTAWKSILKVTACCTPRLIRNMVVRIHPIPKREIRRPSKRT